MSTTGIRRSSEGVGDVLTNVAWAVRPHTGEPRRRTPDTPPVGELLDVDREYRARAATRSLPTVAPHRFNPFAERWLPVLHTVRGARHFAALYSNTALAHRIARTHDWVVLYYHDRDGDHQCTVVTAYRGPLAGRRIVRGRESECISHYHLNTPRDSERRAS